ncbi:trypsin-like peptidase domain-containing protein [Streptomyces sp. DSM 44917]|uniref:Trypsin-like peptidase domain-containing protein n=2 Tax=Streptomyces boetiae TaxID=3075541 RepID=A0ABU2LFY7_9ACTN|nr:trypsin-like peptidase domain-containing protein [Streptomyces sp. DSM 44917]MDT0310486.1 trypsin-like peptidase domain-containing protein [Streptomyces sp. DSM 44917]
MPHRPSPARPAAALPIALALVTALGGAGCTGPENAAPHTRQATGGRAPAPTVSGELQNAYEEVVNEVLPSVVQITTADGLGSGVVYDDRGHIVTNAHVLGEGERFEVLLATGQQAERAELVASYPEQDLAVIELEDVPDRLRPATFGDSSKVEVGQIVLAMGNPLGLSSSVTQGIVSAVGRSVSEGEGQATLGNMVQTSAAINPGNSGGALVNLSGQVIGIPTLAARDPGLGGGQAPGIGFAIPASTVTFLADQMIEHGRVVDSGRAALGVSVRTVLGEGFEPAGAAVVEAPEDGPAARAGIRAGDVVVAVSGDEVTDVVTLSEALAAHRPGDRVEVTYERNGDRRTAEVTLGEA